MEDPTSKYMEPADESVRETVTGDGEVIEATAQPIREENPPRTAPARAPGGGVIPAPAATAGQFIDLLEDGQLTYEMQQELQQLAQQVRGVARATNGKAKGKLVLTVTLATEGDGEAFHIQGAFKATAPELPRRRSIMWQDDSGAFTRFPPNQAQMFGSAPIRRLG